MRQKSRHKFVPITIEKYIELYAVNHPNLTANEFRLKLREMLKAKTEGARCACGESIWVIGSIEVGMSCFTCITGQAFAEDDYEVIP